MEMPNTRNCQTCSKTDYTYRMKNYLFCDNICREKFVDRFGYAEIHSVREKVESAESAMAPGFYLPPVHEWSASD